MEQLFLELTDQEIINTFGGEIVYKLIYDEECWMIIDLYL